MSQQSALFPAGQRLPYLLVASTMLMTGMMVGLSMPLLALLLEQKGMSASFIGISTATPAIATLLVTPLLPRLVAIVGTNRLMLLGSLTSIGCFLLYLVINDPWAWFPLRFVHGIANGILFTVAEFWINAITPDKNRGRVLGIYAAVLSGGFALGPVILATVGVAGWAPFLAGAAIMAVATIPLLVSMAHPTSVPKLHGDAHAPVLRFLIIAPVATLAGLISGVTETSIFNLLPVYLVKLDMPVQETALALTVVGLGNMVLQPAIGWLADKMDRRALLAIGAGVGGIGLTLIPLAASSPWLLWPVLFLSGGIIMGFYTVGLALIGGRFSGPDLVAANAAFLMLYSTGSILGPVLSGGGMDLWQPHGLIAVLTGLALLYMLVILQRIRADRAK